MALFKVLFKKSAHKELRAVPAPYLRKIIEKIKDLSKNPRPADTQMLTGEGRYFRLRQNDYRLIYEINDSRSEIVIIKIGHRQDIYN